MSVVLQNEFQIVLITPTEHIRQQLLIIEEAGRTCYRSHKEEITEESAEKFARMLRGRGHLSVFEHTLIVVKVLRVSRGFTHEMVRHRHTGFSQSSTRYIDYAKDKPRVDLDAAVIEFIAPPHRDPKEKVRLDDGRELSFDQMTEEIEAYYKALRRAGWLAEDARQILPIGTASELVVSASIRQWRNIFAVRCTKAAHWEIRSVMNELLIQMQELLPGLFDDFIKAGEDKNNLAYYEISQ